MKIIHTSDWHLGKKLYKKDRLPEQKLFLDWLVNEIERQKAHVLVISGDIFDTPMPPTEALSLFFSFLKSLEKISFINDGPLIKVVIIGGNHDGARLLEAPRPFLDKDLITILGRPRPPKSTSAEDLKLWKNQNSLKINGDRLFIGMLPYFRVSDFIDSPFKEEIDNYPELTIPEQIIAQLQAWSDNLLSRQEHQDHQNHSEKSLNILLGHHLFGSFMPGGSEQGVSLSGLDSIPLNTFKDWDILMLGHIHKAQVLKKENPLAVYCGSPLPMRFSESNEKKVFIYTQDEKGKSQYAPQSIPVFRPLIKITSTPEQWFEELLLELKKWGPLENPLKAYVEISIQFDKFIPNYIDFIREQIRELPVELLNYFALHQQDESESSMLKVDVVKNSSLDELFDLYLTERGVDDCDRSSLSKTFKEITRNDKEEEKEEKKEEGSNLL